MKKPKDYIDDSEEFAIDVSVLVTEVSNFHSKLQKKKNTPPNLAKLEKDLREDPDDVQKIINTARELLCQKKY